MLWRLINFITCNLVYAKEEQREQSSYIHSDLQWYNNARFCFLRRYGNL